jgi:hypothetical protein
VDVLLDVASGGVFLLSQGASSGEAAGRVFTGKCFHLDPSSRLALLKIRLAVFDRLEETQIPEGVVRRLASLAHSCLEHHLEIRLKSFDLFEQVIGREEQSA